MPIIGPMPPAPKPPAAADGAAYSRGYSDGLDAGTSLPSDHPLLESQRSDWVTCDTAVYRGEDADRLRGLADEVDRGYGFRLSMTNAPVESVGGLYGVGVRRIPSGEVEMIVHHKGQKTEYASILEPASARRLAHALLAAAGPEPAAEPDPRDPSTWLRYRDHDGLTWWQYASGFVLCEEDRDAAARYIVHGLDDGRTLDYLGCPLDYVREPFGLWLVSDIDPGDPSTWVRYVDRDGDEWFEFAPGRVGCGSRENVGSWVQSRIDAGGDPTNYSARLDDVRESCGLRRA